MLKKMMDERSQKMKEIDELLGKLSVLHAEVMDLQRQTARGIDSVIGFRSGVAAPGTLVSHSPRAFPSFIIATGERIKMATMAAIGEGRVDKSLFAQAEKDTEWAVTGGLTNG
jgi:hypothetical protein